MTLKEFRPEGVTGPEHEDFFYRSFLTGPQGAHYELFREQHHTDDHLKQAKLYIRNNFDAVSIHTIKETT